jgi:hypothetical protein
MSQFAKKKKCKTQKCKVSRKHLKFWCFIENRLWRFVEALKMTRKPVHTCAHFFFRNSARHFGVFGTFNLESRVKFRKKAFFDVFLKKFSLLRFTGWGRRPHFYMGRKSELLFFRKVRNTFSVLGPILCCFRKSVRTKMTTPTDYPYRPFVAQFSYVFLFRFRLWNGVKKKVNGFAVPLYRIWK